MVLAVPLRDVAITLTVFIFLFTIPSIRSLAKGSWRTKCPNLDQSLYEDEDGVASPESTAQFSNKIQFITVFALITIGIALSIVDAVFTAIDERSRIASADSHLVPIFLLIPAWSFLLLQLIETSLQKIPVKRFNSAISKLVSCSLLVGIAWISLLDDTAHATTLITSLQLASVIGLMATILSIKRRPVVFLPDGKVVDEQMSINLWSKYSFEWCADTLAIASQDKFGNSDIPALGHKLRSENAIKEFTDIIIKDNIPLWAQILWAFKGALTRQWLSILFSNFFDVAPDFAMLLLLQYMETRTDPNAIEPGAWKYAAGIAVANISSRMVDSRIMWWSKTDLVIPLRSILTGLMYAKALKINDSSAPPEEFQAIDVETKFFWFERLFNRHELTDQQVSSKEEDIRAKDKKNSDAKPRATSQEDVVNMFAVDCNAIAIFGEKNTEYINCLGKLIVTVVFLLVLIGWQSLCAGMIGIAVLFPINNILAGRYGSKQKSLMEIRDRRTQITTEALNGIRQIKFSATEVQWSEKLEAVREDELKMLWKTRLDSIYMSIASESTPIVLTSLSLSTYSWVHGNLLPSVAFTAISLFLQLDGLVSHIPQLMVEGINAKVSCDRIQNFLRLPEKPDNTSPGESISFHNASVSFPNDSQDSKDDQFALRDLNLQFPNNALSVISGPTGSGKSLLLAAILGEVEVLSGFIQVPKSPEHHFDSRATPADWIIPNAIAFVSQTPWIENATIKDNIVFGLPYDPVRYEKVINACALTQDLAMLEDGDQTEVGAQGISLSGGQRWRLTLARAFYSRAGIIILDDVFSALDAHVGKHIYDNAVMGELAEGRTRILATHHTSLCLPRAEYAVRLSSGGVLEHAGLLDALKQEGVLDDILETDETTEPKYVEEDQILRAQDNGGASAILSEDAAVAVKAPPKKLIEEESRETGRVKTSVYSQYLHSSGGWPFWSFLFIIFAVDQSFILGRTYWIRIWANAFGEAETAATLSYVSSQYHNVIQPRLFDQQPIGHLNCTNPVESTLVSSSFPIDTQNRTLGFYLGIYCLISTVSVVLSIGRVYFVYSGSIRASRRIFKGALYSVLRAPLRWLDTVPMGRVLNRFTADFASLDSSLAQDFYYFALTITEITGILVAAIFISPWMILCAIVLLLTSYYFARTYIAAARNTKRLDSINKSPLISHFAASLSGLSTIRAFARSSQFRSQMFTMIDTYAACSWCNSLFRSWLMLRIGITNSLFAAVVAIFVITKRGIDASLAGFALSFALSFGWSVTRAVQTTTQVELDMNAAERIFEYRDLTTEDQGGEDVRATWPEEGKVVIENLELGYAEGLPSILKGLSFTAEKNQRIGIIGRTGAGKSTLSLALFRFLQARKGSITIDGVDISRIKLHSLRTRLAIIPQDPILFSGTIRTNLDPFNEFTDYQLKEALMRVHLIPSTTHTPLPEPTTTESSTASSTTAFPVENKNIFLTLSAPIASGGSNLSQGQKQLLCLARAILSRPKVLLLDEATSAVDMSTDTLIQRSIRDEFSNTTLLVIAHRLSTIADFDRILVMKDGRNAEFGSPRELLGKEGGLFKGMVAQSGEREVLEGLILGGGE